MDAKAEESFLKAIEMEQGSNPVLGQLLAQIYASGYGVPKNDVEAYKWLLIGRQATPLMAHIQKAPWGFSSAEMKEGQKLAEEWLTKHGKKLTVTQLSLPNNNNN